MDNTKTAAPTLTAEERGMLASVRDDWAWEDNNRNEDAVVSQREYVENLRVTFAIIDRLLAVGAPTANSSSELLVALKAAFRTTRPDGCSALKPEVYEMCRAAIANAGAAPAEGGGA